MEDQTVKEYAPLYLVYMLQLMVKTKMILMIIIPGIILWFTLTLFSFKMV